MPGKSPLTQMLVSTPHLPNLPKDQMRIVTAMRVAVMANAKALDVKPYINQHIINEKAAHHFAHVMESIGDSWPEPVCVHRPCCPVVSYDEMLLLDLVTAVVRDDEDRFHDLVRDMLGERDRRRIHTALSKFVRCFDKPKAKQV